MTVALEAGEWSAARPGRILPPGKTRCSFYRRLGGPQDRSGRAENLVLTGIRSRTVQPVAQSLYRLSYPVHSSLGYSRENKTLHIEEICDLYRLVIMGWTRSSNGSTNASRMLMGERFNTKKNIRGLIWRSY